MKVKMLIAVFSVLFMVSMGSAQGASTDLQINVTDAEPMPLQSGEYADIWFRVTNVGDATANNAVIELEEEFPFHSDDRRDRWELGELRRGESYVFRAQVRVDENAVFGENDLKLRKTSGNRDVWIKETVPLEIRTDDRSLIVRSLDFPQKVEPGSSADMNIQMENLANSKFRNIDIDLRTDNIPVAPRETSRQRISGLSSGESENLSFTVDIDEDADNQLHDLPIRITYQDQAGNFLNMSETTGVHIGGFPNLDVAVEDSDIRSSGRGEVTFRVVNRGEGQARFAELKLEDSDQYEVLSEDSIYLGTMIDDDFQTAEFDLYVDEDEQLELPVTVSYRDGEGDRQESFDVQRTLYTDEQLRQFGLGQDNSLWVVLLILGTVAAAGGAYYWRNKRD